MIVRPLSILALAAALPAAAADPPVGGTISIEARTGDGDYDSAMPVFMNATADAFAAKGFTILEDPGHSAYVVELVLTRAAVGTGKAKVATGRAAAAPGGTYGSVGAGVVIPFSTGQSTLVPLLRVGLKLRMRKRGAADVVWHGDALTVRAAGTRNGANAMVAADLSQAVLRDYPAQPEDTVAVP